MAAPTQRGSPQRSTNNGSTSRSHSHRRRSRRSGDTFEAFFVFILQNADNGATIGTDNVRLFLTLDRAAETLTGTFVSQIKDTNGGLIIEVTGDYAATRITV